MLEGTYYNDLINEISDGLSSLEIVSDAEKNELLSNLAEKYITAGKIFDWELWKMIEHVYDLESAIFEFYHTLREAEHPVTELYWKSISSNKRFQIVIANYLMRTSQIPPS